MAQAGGGGITALLMKGMGNVAADMFERGISNTLSRVSRYILWKVFRSFVGLEFFSGIFQAFIKEDRHQVHGIDTDALIESMLDVVEATVILAIILGDELVEELTLEMIQEAFSQAVQTSVGGCLSTVLNTHVGGQPPYVDYVFNAGQYIDGYDELTLPLLTASTGANLPFLGADLVRGVNEKIMEDYRQVELALVREIDDYNMRVRELIDVPFHASRQHLIHVIFYARTLRSRLARVTERIAERHLARANELDDTVESLRAWYEAGLISEEAFKSYCVRMKVMAEASKQVMEEYVSTINSKIDELLGKWDELEENALKLHFQLLSANAEILTKISDAIATQYDEYRQSLIDKINKAIEDASAYRGVKPPVVAEPVESQDGSHNPIIFIDVSQVYRGVSQGAPVTPAIFTAETYRKLSQSTIKTVTTYEEYRKLSQTPPPAINTREQYRKLSQTTQTTPSTAEKYRNITQMIGRDTVEEYRELSQTAVTTPANASGLDPNDPTWCPAGGWTQVWEFNTEDELNDFANDTLLNCHTENSKIIYDADENNDAKASRRTNTPKYKRVAICFRVPNWTVIEERNLTIISTEAPSATFHYAIYVEADKNRGVNKLALGSRKNGEAIEYMFNITHGEWYVFVANIASESNMIEGYIYDSNKQCIAYVGGEYSDTTTLLFDYIETYERKHETDVCDLDLEVDWMAVKEE